VFRLAAGKLRARFRESLKKPELLKPGKIYAYKLDLWRTGITIPGPPAAGGSRLGVVSDVLAQPEYGRT